MDTCSVVRRAGEDRYEVVLARLEGRWYWRWRVSGNVWVDDAHGPYSTQLAALRAERRHAAGTCSAARS